MLEVVKSAEFAKWIEQLRDREAIRRIAARLNMLAAGSFGDVKPVGSGISELRITYGPGYRVYFMQVGRTVVLLLCGGDKSTQRKDIDKAKRLAAELEQ